MFNGGMYHSQVTSAVQVTVTYLQGTTLRLSTTHTLHIGYIGATLSKSVCRSRARPGVSESLHHTEVRMKDYGMPFASCKQWVACGTLDMCDRQEWWEGSMLSPLWCAVETHLGDGPLQTLQSQGRGCEVVASHSRSPPCGWQRGRPLAFHCSIGTESRPGENWGPVPQTRPCGPPEGG